MSRQIQKHGGRAGFLPPGLILVALTWLALVASPSVAVAQSGATINTTIAPDVLTLGQSATLRVEISVDGNVAVRVGRLPGGDYIAGAGGSMSSRVNINGRATTQHVRTYRITPTRSGRVEIGMMEVNVGGRSEHTDPVFLEVIDAGSPPATPPVQPPPRQVQGLPTTGDPPPTAPQPAVPETTSTNQPFITTVANSQTIWMGEPFVLDYEAFTPRRASWRMVGITQPSFPNFWFQSVATEQVRDYRQRSATVGSSVFVSHLIDRYVMVGLEPGEYALPGIEAEFNSYTFGRIATLSPPFDVMVRPLPDGAPAGFHQSNVGSYTFSVSAEPNGTRVGDAIRVTMRAEGRGLTSLLELPTPPIAGEARVQAPVESHRQDLLNASEVGGFKEVEWVILPTEEGPISIGPVAFHFFDPALDRYQTVEIPAQTFTIEGFSPTADLLGPAPVEARQSELLAAIGSRRDSAPDASSSRLPGTLFWGLLLLPPIAWLVTGMGSRVRERRAAGAPDRVRRGALASAEQSVREATKEGDPARAASAVSSALRRYLRDRLAIAAGALTLEELTSELRERDVTEDVSSRVGRLLEECQAAAYGGGSLDPKAMAAEASALLRSLESHA